jgi:hypothetical protein
MGLLDNTTHQEYYQGNDYGSYQFVSLEDVIAQFQIAYVGEDKIIPKVLKADIAFHAQRALQELSFDTFKSVKSQQISLPPTLVMPLPHDYVGYTKLSWVDTSGVKHPLYPTSNTSNPFQVAQNSDGKYNFDFVSSTIGILENSDFSSDLTESWQVISPTSNINSIYGGGMAIVDGKLKTSFITTHGAGAYNWGYVHTAYQVIDVSGVNYLDISALGTADNVVIVYVTSPGFLRFGLSTQEPENNYVHNQGSNPFPNASTSNNINASIFDLTDVDGNPSYVEWLATASGSESSTKELPAIDVSSHQTVYAVIVSYVDFLNLPSANTYYTRGTTAALANSIDDLLVTTAEASNSLIPEFGNEKNSSTWNSYKAGTPSENGDDYQDDTYWPMEGSRYGLDPQQAQANGSFYIDDRLGRVHFSSNISGKTVILDYISDSLGTDGEMQVHKFAEEAMYKWIAHAIISTSSYGQQLVPRLKKEKFAAIRQAKLRLSNIKLEELTQILRGKSKQIKH